MSNEPGGKIRWRAGIEALASGSDCQKDTHGTDQEFCASFDQVGGAAWRDWLKIEVGGAHKTYPRRALECAELRGTQVMAWPSWARAGLPGVQAQ
jgi:hypothetical protein